VTRAELAPGRPAGALALAAALIAWYETAPHLGALALWPSVLIVAIVLMPATCAISWLALPLWNDRRLVYVAAAAAALAVGLSALGFQVVANLAKFVTMTALGWLFLTFFEALSWVALVALIIPWVDAYSVWQGPTKTITEHHAGVFTTLSVAFVVPGGSAARLGLPDILFFSVFLAASVRFRLRPFATWLCMTATLGITMTLTTFWSRGGLPALPGISLGFLLPNADLIWQRVRRERAEQRESGAETA
jgi:hypothetical protein